MVLHEEGAMTSVFVKVALVAFFATAAHGATFGDLAAGIDQVCDKLSAVENRNVALLCKIKNEMITHLKAETPNKDANAAVLNLIHSAKKLDHHKVSFLETLIKTLGGLAKAVDEIVKEKHHHNSSRLKKGADDELGSERLSELDLASVDQSLDINIDGGDTVERFLKSLARVIAASESIFKLVRQNSEFAKLVQKAVADMDHIVQEAKDSAKYHEPLIDSSSSSTTQTWASSSTTPTSVSSSTTPTSVSSSTTPTSVSSSTTPTSVSSSTTPTSVSSSTTPISDSSSPAPPIDSSSSASPAVTEESDLIKDPEEIRYPVWSAEEQKWIEQKPDSIAGSQTLSKFPPLVKRYILHWTKPYGPFGPFYLAIPSQIK